MKKNLCLFVCFILFNAIIVNTKIESTKIEKISTGLKGTLKKKGPANKENDGIDGVGTNANLAEKGKSTEPIVLNKSPYKITQCNQILFFEAEYIIDLKDYRQRKKAFYSVNVLNVFLFESKDATKLIHSSNFTQSQRLTQPLKGARGCIAVDGGPVNADITICFKDEKKTNEILTAIRQFAKCRMGDNLVPIDPAKIKKLARACAGLSEEKKDPVKDFEMSLDLRSGNKWDDDRNKFFQPSEIRVPGTPPPLKPSSSTSGRK